MTGISRSLGVQRPARLAAPHPWATPAVVENRAAPGGDVAIARIERAAGRRDDRAGNAADDRPDRPGDDRSGDDAAGGSGRLLGACRRRGDRQPDQGREQELPIVLSN